MPDVFVAETKDRVESVGAYQRDYSTVEGHNQSIDKPWAAFVVKPTRIKFETQEKEEEVLLLLRRHLVTNVPWILLAILGSVVPILEGLLPGIRDLPEVWRQAGTVIWYLLVFGYILENFLTWYFNVFMVTDERIVDVDFYSLIYKRVSAAKIADIEDVTFSQNGVVRAIFDYGTVYMQTAGAQREFEFEDVPHPRKVAAFVNEMYLEEEKEELEGRVR